MIRGGRDRLHELLDASLAELRRVWEGVEPAAASALVEELLAARRIVVHGVGREGLMMRAFAMRLHHAGLDVHVAGETTTPPIGSGDLLVASSGPGGLATVHAMARVAREAGARVLVVTGRPASETAQLADAIVHLPAKTMADGSEAGAPSLPLGSAFEQAQLIVLDCVARLVADRLGRGDDELRERHTNLE